ncbi:magnetosome-associated protein MamJ-like [Kryptolebias marmoratus]|uniref:magnetosome-associated protein MamJ-like n=1 Tax=Kryptolebias marmoratus TaxID=37003 RepID=UPI000D5311F3|nr:magnetosome-associated protein MamJ-like [Kryptolebias marmoratus]
MDQAARLFLGLSWEEFHQLNAKLRRYRGARIISENSSGKADLPSPGAVRKCFWAAHDLLDEEFSYPELVMLPGMGRVPVACSAVGLMYYATVEAEPEDPAAEPNVSAAEPEVPAAEPNVSAAEPEVPVAEPEVPAAEPEVPADEPNVSAAEPSGLVAESEVSAAESEVSAAESEVSAAEPSVSAAETSVSAA